MTEEADIAGLYQQLKEIVTFTESIKNIAKEGSYTFSNVSTDVEALVDEYDNARPLFERIKGNTTVTMEYIGLPSRPEMRDVREMLIKLPIECMKVMAVLEKLSHPRISEKDISELHSLRGELEKISSKIDVNIDKNIEMAIDEYETGHYLSSALLSSRVIVSELDKVKGKSDEETIKELKDSGKIKNKRKDTIAQLIKASKLSRHFLSHNPNIFAEPDEALSLLSDCIRIVKLVNE